MLNIACFFILIFVNVERGGVKLEAIISDSGGDSQAALVKQSEINRN